MRAMVVPTTAAAILGFAVSLVFVLTQHQLAALVCLVNSLGFLGVSMYAFSKSTMRVPDSRPSSRSSAD